MFCSSCGEKTSNSDKFCSHCGKKIIEKTSKSTSLINNKDYSKYIAHGNKRFFNAFIDGIGLYIFSFLSAFVLGYIGILSGDEGDSAFEIVGILSYICYYLFFESIYFKTPGKMLTKTLVVNSNGSKPEFGTILKRTLIRLVPFEVLSFLGRYPVGWHDKWSGTLVIDDKI